MYISCGEMNDFRSQEHKVLMNPIMFRYPHDRQPISSENPLQSCPATWKWQAKYYLMRGDRKHEKRLRCKLFTREYKGNLVV